MTREATLLAKQEDLKKCIQTRNALLRDLYRSTAVLSNIRKQLVGTSSLLNIDLAGEKAFLDANDISLGRYFQPSTLPPPSPKLSPGQESPTTHAGDANALHAVDRPLFPTTRTPGQSVQSANTIGSRDLGPISTSIEDSGFTIPTISAPVPPRSEEYDRSHQNADGAEKDTTQSDDIAVQKSLGIDGTPKESQTVGPSTTLPLLADDASKPSDPVLQQLEVGSKPDGAHTVRPPPKEKQEERLEDTDSSRDGHVPKPSSGTDLAEGRSSAHSGDHAHHSLSQSRQEFEPEVPPAQPSENDGSLESQIGLSREATAVGGSSFTPDEQLRLEEAQSLQGHVTDLHARVSTPQTPDTTVAKEAPSAPEQANKDAELEAQTGNIEFKPFDNYRRGQRIVDEASEISGFRNSAYPGLAGDVAKDVTFSQRPPMRIDTELSQQAEQSRSSSFKKPLENNAAVTHTPPDSATSARASHSSAPAQSPPERMTTRVSSGALRHKSVSEILGETSKPVTPHTDKASNERTTTDTNRDAAGLQSPRSSVSVTSPDTAAFRLRLNELKEKDKSKLSTVIFARKQPLQPTRHSENLRHREPDVTEEKTKNTDYFYPLIHAQAATPPRAQLLNRLIGSAAKTLTTANHYVDYHEQQDCRILSKIEQLQKANRWSLRQMERSAEPERPTVHWDVLLSQMKWLRTDFREERKWKIAAASSVANWCAQWVSGSKEERVALQVKVRPQPHVHSAASRSTPTPDLIPSAEDDSSDGAEDEVGNVDVFSGKAPAAIFSMAPDTFYFGLQKTPSAEKLLQELPLYHPSLEVQQAALHHSRVQSDKDWKTPLLPVSKFGDGKLLSHDEGPPRKKSRYDYAELDEVHQFSLELPDSDPRTLGLRPEQDDVALFNPENKHIRDRIHAGHAFRPPSEHVMPSQSFFESRHASQWTQSEDDELRRLVREYAYNWSLISSCLSVPSSFSSAAERRTPWECFERWIGLEGLPAEMAKTQYFRAYHARLQAAQTTHEAQQQLLQQQQGNNAPLRRRSTQPFLVERRRNTKHVHLVNAMKNLARKREAVPKKAEKAIDSAAIRKAASATQPRPAMQTPREFSKLRHERDLKMQEQARAYRMQMMQQQKIHAAQRAGLQSGQPPNGANLPPGRGGALPAIPNGNCPPNLLPNGQAQQGQCLSNQPRPPQMPRPPNGIPTNGAFASNQPGIPHAPMQPAPIPGPARMPPQMGSDNMRVFQEVTRVQAEQQRFLQQQRQQQHPQLNGQLSPNLANSNFLPPNASSAHANFQRRSGSPSVNGALTPNGSSTSPRMTNPPQPQALSGGMTPTINQIMSQTRARNPTATPEQISQMATDRLKQYSVHSHAQAAMQAAAGNNANATAMNGNSIGNLQAPSQQQPPTAVMNPGTLTTTQQYAQMVRNQQQHPHQNQHQHQQNRHGGTPFSSGQRPSSRSATPQLHRTPSAQGLHPSPSPVPVPSQAQVAGGQ